MIFLGIINSWSGHSSKLDIVDCFRIESSPWNVVFVSSICTAVNWIISGNLRREEEGSCGIVFDRLQCHFERSLEYRPGVRCSFNDIMIIHVEISPPRYHFILLFAFFWFSRKYFSAMHSMSKGEQTLIISEGENEKIACGTRRATRWPGVGHADLLLLVGD